MSDFTRIAGTSIVIVAICLVIMIVGSTPAAVATQQQLNDKLLERLKIQTFGGEAASLRAKQLRKQHKGIARAMKDAEKRGLREAFDKGHVILATDVKKTANPGSVVKANLFPSQLGLVRSISLRLSPPEDTFTDGDIEITFIPYDDGDPNTWEGIVYRYVPGMGEDTNYAVINIAADEPDVAQEFYYPPDGGDPEPNQLLLTLQKREAQNSSAPSHMKVAFRGSRALLCPAAQHVCLGAQAGECCLDSGLPGIKTWIKKSAGLCTYAAIACRLSGPAWTHCFGAWCTGGMVYALFW